MKPLALAVLLLTTPCLAQSATWQFLLKKYDGNGDGRIAAEEYDRGKDRFVRLDKDKDGELTAADFESRPAGGRRNRRTREGSGERRARTSFQEKLWFEVGKLADADRSGNVPASEWQEFLAALDPNEHGEFDNDKLPLLSGGPMARMMTRSFDVDRDGDITTADLEGIFGKLDTNEDGELQRNELGTAPIAGQLAPDFELPSLTDANQTVRLSSYRGKQPVGLIFGSYT